MCTRTVDAVHVCLAGIERVLDLSNKGEWPRALPSLVQRRRPPLEAARKRCGLAARDNDDGALRGHDAVWRLPRNVLLCARVSESVRMLIGIDTSSDAVQNLQSA